MNATGGWKMRKVLHGLLAAAMCCAGASAAYGFGGMIAVGMNEMAEVSEVTSPFRAEARMRAEGEQVESVIYFDDGRIREELQAEGHTMVMLYRHGGSKAQMLMPQGMYMEFDLGTEQDTQVEEYRLVERTRVGRETVNGFDTTRYRVVFAGPDGRYEGDSWFTDDNIGVRCDMTATEGGKSTRVLFDITRLERGPQDDALFEVPAGYRKLDLGALGVGGMGGMGGAGAMPGAGGYPAPQAPADGNEPNIVDEVGEAAQQGAEEAAKEEAREGAKDAVKKGLRKLFGG